MSNTAEQRKKLMIAFSIILSSHNFIRAYGVDNMGRAMDEAVTYLEAAVIELGYGDECDIELAMLLHNKYLEKLSEYVQ